MTLDRMRRELEEISIAILEQLNRRAARALEVGAYKQRLGMPIRDPQREAQLLERLLAQNRGPLDNAAVRALFRHIFDAGVVLMERQRRLTVSVEAGPRVVIEVRGHVLGDGPPQYIAGPCSVENEDQMEQAARRLAQLGVGFFRAGAFKPRTSPYSFSGLGLAGLELLHRTCRRHGLASVTEATSPANAEQVAEHADVIQIGARNMYNYELLRAVGQTRRPVLLKRAFSATLEEWLNAAEYVALAGSESIVLCERGIRTFAKETRGTLDLGIVPLAKAASRLPVIVDVSHAAGRRDILPQMAAAAFGVGAQAVMLEVHPDPDVALSDSEQQLDLDGFSALQQYVAASLQTVGAALEQRRGE